jgi:hypothetical protein
MVHPSIQVATTLESATNSCSLAMPHPIKT